MCVVRLLTYTCIANQDDPLAKEREAPPEPLPVQFPEYCPPLKTTPLTAQKHANLKKLLMGIKNPTDIAPWHVEAFNVKYRSNVSMSDLVPNLPDGLIEEAALNTLIKDELSLENDPCYRKVCRLPPEKGQTLPRLAQAYLFYKSLEDMSRYWDNSKDNYFTKTSNTASSPTQPDGRRQSLQKENIKPPADPNGDVHMTNSAAQIADKTPPSAQSLYIGRRSGNAATMPPNMRDGVLDGLLRAAAQKFNALCKPPSQQHTRLQVGELLIPVRQTFVVGRVPSDRNEARKAKILGPLMVGSSRSEVVFRKEGEEVGEGQGEVADFLRELGGLLLLAQQRNRDGCAEVTPGSDEHCWWARKERWGGGAGGKMPHEEVDIDSAEEFPKIDGDVVMKDASDGHTRGKRAFDTSAEKDKADIAALPKAATATKPSLNNPPSPHGPGASSSPLTASAARPSRPPMSARRVKLLSEAWKTVKPPSAIWDPNTTYRAIGKSDGPDGEWDDIFMLSSVNSHVCLLRMRVSKGYLGWLETGEMGEMQSERKVGRSGITLPVEESKDWEGDVMRREVLYVERSEWWDFFEPQERVEALTGLWRVLSWLNREVGGGKLPWAVE